ncbi:MAG: fibronectin type III domain-containing protein [Patescibacteria group bacterium]
MNKKKLLIVIGILLLSLGIPLGILGLKQFREPTSKASPENKPQLVREAEVTSESAAITWVTSESAYGFVSYGETAELGRTAQEETKTEAHRVTLYNLKPNTTYYYKVGVGEQLFDNNGVPYSFTTPKKTATQETEKEEKEKTTTTQEPPTKQATESSGFEEEKEKDDQKEEDDQTELTLEGFEEALGTTNESYDLDGDGEVTALDISLFIAQEQDK